MGRLTAIKPRVQQQQPTLHAAKAGDNRIRGGALKAIRARILRRDYGLCQCAACQASALPLPASVVDHRIPLWAGGTEADGNRQSLSTDCHDRKSAHEAAQRAKHGALVEPWDGR